MLDTEKWMGWSFARQQRWIWKTILKEKEQVIEEHTQYDSKGMLKIGKK